MSMDLCHRCSDDYHGIIDIGKRSPAVPVTPSKITRLQ
jgi:hypothetical protein